MRPHKGDGPTIEIAYYAKGIGILNDFIVEKKGALKSEVIFLILRSALLECLRPELSIDLVSPRCFNLIVSEMYVLLHSRGRHG
jgi:hypothetical protein